jgi:NAD(P)-dependent dehydrogenase (short-subunit alcohol dehydrogenase family)
MIDLGGKVAIVTGSASGIGAASAAQLARLGAAVVLADINGAGARDRVAELTADGALAVAVETDVCDPVQVEHAVATALSEFGRLDILHNNAADMEVIGRDSQVVEMDLEVWERTLRANLTGQMLGCKYAIPPMIESGGGSIVNTASVSGQRAEYYATAYPVSKAGVIHLTQEVALQYGRSGIRCNAVAPGLTLSPPGLGLPAEITDMYLRHNMVPRLGQPDDIAAAVAFLASDAARYVSGEVITIDGGLTKSIPISADIRDWMTTHPGAV